MFEGVKACLGTGRNCGKRLNLRELVPEPARRLDVRAARAHVSEWTVAVTTVTPPYGWIVLAGLGEEKRAICERAPGDPLDAADVIRRDATGSRDLRRDGQCGRRCSCARRRAPSPRRKVVAGRLDHYPREAGPGACALPPAAPEGSTSTLVRLDQEPAPFLQQPRRLHHYPREARPGASALPPASPEAPPLPPRG